MLRNSLLFFAIVSLADPIIAASTSEVCYHGPCVKIFYPSGKIRITPASGIDEDDPRAITMEFVSIKEVDANGKQVSKTGPNVTEVDSHSFSSFQFSFGRFDTRKVKYKGIVADKLDSRATFLGKSLYVLVYLFTEAGTIDLCNDEKIDIKKGIVNSIIEVSGWSFCKVESGCTGTGKYLDLLMTVKSKGTAIKGAKEQKQAGKKRKPQKFFFGTSKSLAFPSAVTTDGRCTEMPEEYPKLEVKEGKNYITLRFPTFEDKLTYDPVVNLEDHESPYTTDSSKLNPSVGVVMILGVFTRLLF